MHRMLRMTLCARTYLINKKKRVSAGVALTFKRKLKSWHPISRVGTKKNTNSCGMATYKHEESKTMETKINGENLGRMYRRKDGISIIKIDLINFGTSYHWARNEKS